MPNFNLLYVNVNQNFMHVKNNVGHMIALPTNPAADHSFHEIDRRPITHSTIKFLRIRQIFRLSADIFRTLF